MKKSRLIASVLVIFVSFGRLRLMRICGRQIVQQSNRTGRIHCKKQTKSQNAALVNGKAIPMSDYEAGLEQSTARSP